MFGTFANVYLTPSLASRMLYGEQARFFEDELVPSLKHDKVGVVAMASAGKNLNASQVSSVDVAHLACSVPRHVLPVIRLWCGLSGGNLDSRLMQGFHRVHVALTVIIPARAHSVVHACVTWLATLMHKSSLPL